jgi:hypothetical protein
VLKFAPEVRVVNLVRPSVRSQSRWRQVTGWVAAYAVALYALLAASIFPHIASGTVGDEASALTLCVSDLSGSVPGPDGTPANIDCDFHCTMARGVGMVFAGPASAILIEFEIPSISWPVAESPPPSRIQFIRERPRGPPRAA